MPFVCVYFVFNLFISIHKSTVWFSPCFQQTRRPAKWCPGHFLFVLFILHPHKKCDPCFEGGNHNQNDSLTQHQCLALCEGFCWLSSCLLQKFTGIDFKFLKTCFRSVIPVLHFGFHQSVWNLWRSSFSSQICNIENFWRKQNFLCCSFQLFSNLKLQSRPFSIVVETHYYPS